MPLLICRFNVFVADYSPPTIQCPRIVVYTYSTQSETFFQLNESYVNVSVSSGNSNAFFKSEPSLIYFNYSEMEPTFPPYKVYDIAANVTDSADNSASCIFQIKLKRKYFTL